MATADTSGAGSSTGLTDELKQDAAKLGNVAGDRLSSEADAHKGEVATQARNVSSALEKAADELGGQEETPDWLRSSLQQGAQTLQRLADSVEKKNPRELLDDFNALGREHPGAFLGACAAAGFAVARVFKAGAAGAATQGSYAMGGASSGAGSALGVSQAGAFPAAPSSGGQGSGGLAGSPGTAAPYVPSVEADEALAAAISLGAQ